MRLFVDIIVEIFLEVYMELMLLIAPERGRTKQYVFFAKLLAVTVLLAVLALVIWGAILIGDYGNLLGIIPITAATVISVVQIVAGIVLYNKNHG